MVGAGIEYIQSIAAVITKVSPNTTEIDLRNSASGPHLQRILTTMYPFNLVKGTGDINGDGRHDIITFRGAYHTETQFIMVIYGRPSPFTDIVLANTIPPAVGFAIIGLGVSANRYAALGDVNGDGFDDIIIGEWHLHRAIMIYGKSSPFATVDVTQMVAGTSTGVIFSFGFGYLGFSVAGPGDMNGDGLSDIVICHVSGRGAAIIVHGSSTFPALVNLGNPAAFSGSIVPGTGPNNGGDPLGGAASAAGDVNNDGIPDVVVSAHTYVMIIYGRATAPYQTSKILPVLASGQTITTLAPAGDINQDGCADILIGSFWASKTFLLMGSTAIEPINLSTYTRFIEFVGSAGSQLGEFLGGGRDVNGDGFPDIVMGARWQYVSPVSGGAQRRSVVYLIHGPLHASPTASPTFPPPSALPTVLPSAGPTHVPTFVPTVLPTAIPTAEPSVLPTADPTALPTFAPTQDPTTAPTAAPSTEPSVLPTPLPTQEPTVHPTPSPSTVPTAAPSEKCLKWILGAVGVSCTDTCQYFSPARACHDTHFASVQSVDSFRAMLGTAVNGLTGAAVGDDYCNGGITNSSARGVPEVLSSVRITDHGHSVSRTCAFSAGPAAQQSGCDAPPLGGFPVRQLCPCVHQKCDELPVFLGWSGESCTATCTREGGVCAPVETQAATDPASFAAFVAGAVSVDTRAELGTEFCSAVNAPQFSVHVPAIVTVSSPDYVNATFCSFPTVRSYTNFCDVELHQHDAQRLCACAGRT